jgi:hypothetical protein
LRAGPFPLQIRPWLSCFPLQMCPPTPASAVVCAPVLFLCRSILFRPPAASAVVQPGPTRSAHSRGST